MIHFKFFLYISHSGKVELYIHFIDESNNIIASIFGFKKADWFELEDSKRGIDSSINAHIKTIKVDKLYIKSAIFYN